MYRLLCACCLWIAALPLSAQLPAGTRDAEDHSKANSASAKLSDAEAMLEKGDFTNAAKLLESLAADRPKDARLLYDLGYADERIGKETGAALAYADAIAVEPEFAEPQVALGLLDARGGRLDKAHGELARVAHQASAAPALRARALRALAQMDAEARPAEASDELLAAIKLTGETQEDIALSGAMASRSGDISGAAGEYRRLLSQHPDNADAAAGLAHVLSLANKPAEAEQVLSAPLKAHPDDPRLLSQMAANLAAQGKTKEAIPLLVKLRADPKFANETAVTRQLARLYMLDGDNAQAEAMFVSALNASPKDAEDPGLMDDLGTVLVRQQKYVEAEKLLTQAVALRERFETPQAFGDAAGHLAFAASKNGHPAACLQALAARATVLPNSGPSLFLEATAHDTLHQYKEAQRAYRAFLAIAGGQFPDQEFQAKHRLVALEHMK